MFFTNPFKTRLPDNTEALPGREASLFSLSPHLVYGTSMQATPEPDMETIYVGMGCFWGVERLFWQMAGVVMTASGYAGGVTPHPTYEEVCSGQTGHTEAVKVVFDPNHISRLAILKIFWESHDPTQGMRQGNDRGTQYRSALYTTSEDQHQDALSSAQHYGQALAVKGLGLITTEISAAGPFYFAEDYHQQYLYKNPNGYCGLAGCNVRYPA